MFLVPRFARLAAIALAAAVGTAAPAAAQSDNPTWMRGLDELMSLEVTSVSKKEQRLADTSAAVYVLGREDIRRSGLRTVPELLRLIPGLHVAQIDGNKWAISSRGMSSRWSNKLQVMIDGRSIYTPYFASVFWDAVDVPVQAIERIEVIRGPGASVWGANAVNGVINIITMGAAIRRETSVAGGAGSTDFGSVLHEGRVGDRVGYRLFADASGYDELKVSGGAGAQDDWMQRRIGASFQATLNARDSLETSLRASDSHANSRHLAATALAPFDGQYVPFEADAETWAASTRWTRQLTGNGHLQVDGFVDEWRRRDDLDHFRRTADLSLQHRVGGAGRHDVIWGGGVRYTHEVTTGSFVIDLSQAHYDHVLASAFVQDEIRVGERVHLTLGGKVEHRDYTGASLQPTARLHWRMTPRHAVWTAVSRAQRAPDRIERSLRLVMSAAPSADGVPAVLAIQGNPEIAPEWLTSYEAGYRAVLGGDVVVDLAAYYNRYSDLMANVPATPRVEFDRGLPFVFLPLVYANSVDAATAGGEALITYSPSSWWKLSGSYSLFSIDPSYTASATADTFDGLNAPRQHGFLRSTLSVTPTVDVDTTVFAVGGIRSMRQPAYTRVDGRIAWRPRGAVELSLAAQNLFDGRNVEFDSPSSVVAEPSEVPRTAYGAIAWRF
jgi:iron complex outermembrane receptor protein